MLLLFIGDNDLFSNNGRKSSFTSFVSPFQPFPGVFYNE